MKKEKRILSYFLGWLLLGYIILFIGVNNVFASTYYMNYEYYQQYYDNYGSSVTAVTTTWNESLQSYVSANIATTANSYGAGLAISSPVPLISDHTYTISIYFEDRNNIALSSKNHIAISTSLTGAATNYANGNYYVDMIQSNVNNNTVLQFVFTTKGGGSFIFIPWTTTYNTSQSYVITQIVMEDLGNEGISQTDINTSLANQTNEINTSIENSTNTITGSIGDAENNINSNINDMEQSIVDSNKETQEVIKDQFESCKPGNNLLENVIWNNGYYLNSNNEAVASTSWRYSDYIDITKYDGNYIYKNDIVGSSPKTILYDSNKNVLQVLNVNNTSTFYLKQYNATYIRVSTTLVGRPVLYVEEICSNRLDETNDKLDETNNQLGDLNNSLTDSSPTDMSGLGDSAGWLPAGPVDSILTLPLTLFTTLSNNLSNNTCTTAVLPLPFVNKNINLPCIKTLYDKIGITGTLFTTAGIIASCFILFNYLLSLYNWVDKTLTMRENTMPGYYDDNWGGGA